MNSRVNVLAVMVGIRTASFEYIKSTVTRLVCVFIQKVYQLKVGARSWVARVIRFGLLLLRIACQFESRGHTARNVPSVN